MKCSITDIFKTFEEVKTKTKLSDKYNLLLKVKDCPQFRTIVEIVYNKDVKTYTSYDTVIRYECGEKQQATWEEFVELIGLISNRKLIGKDKDQALRDFFKRCDKFHCYWYKMIISKDLRIGVGLTLVKKVLGLKDIDLGIKVSPMLAYDITSLKDKSESLLKQYDWSWEIKIDGLRVLTVFTDNGFVCYSRNSKRLQNIENILLNGLKPEVIKAMQGWILDGEFYSKDWSKSMTSAFTKNKVIEYTPDMKYYVFDIVPIKAFESGSFSTPYIKRKEKLKQLMRMFDKPFTYVEQHKLTNSSLSNVLFIAEKQVEKGWEGIVLKANQSPYVTKRSKYWLKVKLFKTIDVLCTGIIPSTKHHNEIAAITFRYKSKECKCGSGFTQQQRKEFYKNPDLIVDKIVELKYQEESVDGCLRFPVFVRVRYDKDIPDA